jgi:hypothetical protein
VAKSKAFTMTDHGLGPIAHSLVVRIVATIIALLSASMWVCAQPKLPPQATSDSISIEAMFVDAKGNPLPVDDRPGDFSLTLGAIAGSIGGMPVHMLQTVPIAKQSAIDINLLAFATAAAQLAEPINAAATESGLRIDPIDTRFVRASTLLTYEGASSGPLAIAFVDRDSKNTLILMYFDRRCRLTGTKEIANRGSGEKLTQVYDVIIKKPGLSWLVRTPQGRSGFMMRVADEARPMLVVAPVENLKHGSVQIH